MKKKLTPKQHKFCECIVKGMNQSDSYREAYDTSKMSDKIINDEAYKLLKDPDITLRIDELRKEVLEDIKYTVTKSFNNLVDLQNKALNDKDIRTAVKCEELKGKLFGLYVDKKQINGSLDIVKKFELWKKRGNNNKVKNE